MFRVGDFSTPLRRHAVFPCLSTVIPASSVKCIAFSRLALGSPAPVFSPCVVIFRFFAAFRPPAWAFVVSHAGRAGRLFAPLGRSLPSAPSVPFFLHASSLFAFLRLSAPPLGRFTPAPGVPGFCSVAGGFPRPRLGVLSPAPGVPVCCSIVSGGFPRPPLGRSLPSAPGVPGFCSIVGRLPAPRLGVRCLPRRASFSPAWTFFAFCAGRAGLLLRCRRFPRRGRIPIGKQALPRSAGKRKAYRKRRKLTNELPPLLNDIFGHTLRFAPAALLPRNIRYGKTACRPTLPVSRG